MEWIMQEVVSETMVLVNLQGFPFEVFIQYFIYFHADRCYNVTVEKTLTILYIQGTKIHVFFVQ